MKRSSPLIQSIETKYSKPLSQILIELWEQKGSLTNMAKELNTSPSQIKYWMLREGVRTKMIIEKQPFF